MPPESVRMQKTNQRFGTAFYSFLFHFITHNHFLLLVDRLQFVIRCQAYQEMRLRRISWIRSLVYLYLVAEINTKRNKNT